MKVRITYIILVGMLFASRSLASDVKGLRTNLEFMGQAVEELIAGDTTILVLVPEPSIGLKASPEDQPLIPYLSTHISNALIQMGYRVYTAGDSSESGMILSWIPENVSVTYADPRRSSFFGEMEYTRHVQIRLGIQLVAGNTRRIEWNGFLEAQKSDTVSVHELPIIEQDGRVLGHPIRPKATDFRKWFEPAAMIGITGLIAYLFYSIRS
jgi:hypothetical protein